MTTLSIPWRSALHPDVAAEVVKQAVHAASELTSAAWDEERNALVVTLAPSAPVDKARDKLTRYLTAMVARHRPLPREVLRVRAASRAPITTDAQTLLEAKGWARLSGPGQVALTGPALAFLRALDRRIAALATGTFGAREDAYPVLVPTHLLHRVGYFSSFPHTVSMVSHLREDFDAIERFRSANSGSSHMVVPERDAIEQAGACLSPAVCYHLYPSLSGAQLSEGGLFVTALGRCFRYESKNFRGLLRLWDFSMREIIVCGTEREVDLARERLLDAACLLAESLDLDFIVESATDPFFSAAYSEKAYWQTRNHLKLEMRLLAGEPSARTAAASFNLHEDFFGRTFGFDAGGAAAFTGCAAWGLERWVHAAFTQHGSEPSDWPPSWRDVVFGSEKGP